MREIERVVLVAENLSLRFSSTVALAGASATVTAGEVVSVVGPSGSGKTTMLYCLSGLMSPDAGRVRFHDQDLATLGEDARAALRRRSFGFVFQFAELVPELTLAENIGLPLELLKVPRRQVRSRVDSLVERLGLEAEAGRRPARVSGGQAQRAAVARAVVHGPAVLFADEPTGALDSTNGALVLDTIVDLARENGTAIVLVTHDQNIAARCDRTIHMADGKIVAPIEPGLSPAPVIGQATVVDQ